MYGYVSSVEGILYLERPNGRRPNTRPLSQKKIWIPTIQMLLEYQAYHLTNPQAAILTPLSESEGLSLLTKRSTRGQLDSPK